MKKFLSFLLVLVLSLAIIGCDDTKEVKPTGVSIAGEKTIQLEVNGTFDLVATVTPSDVTDPSVTWESSDSGVASVSSKGKVQGKKAGDAIITVKCNADNTLTDTVTIKVIENTSEEVKPTAIKVVAANTTVAVGTPLTLSLEFTPSDVTNKGNDAVTWSTDNAEVAQVSSSGVVMPIKAGTATITATSKADTNVKGTITITVEGEETPKVPVTELALKGEAEMYTGHTYEVRATITPSDANYDLEWVSSDPSVLEIIENESTTSRVQVSILSAGSVQLTATDIDTQISITLDVTCITSPDLESIEVINGRTITTDEACLLGIQEYPANALYSVTWESSDPSIATIDENGNVTPLAVGTVTFKATEKNNPSLTAEYTMVIEKPFDPNAQPEKVVINSDRLIEIILGYPYRLSVSVFPAGVSSKVTWTSSSPSVATVDEEGNIITHATGTTRIRAISAVATNVRSDIITINVVEETPLPEIPDLGGYKIVIMNAESALSDIDPFLEGYTAADKQYKKDAWTAVQNEYNCQIVVDKYPVAWGPGRVSWIIDNATNGTSQCDFGIVSGAWISSFASANAAVDTTDYFRIYGKNQIEESLKEASSAKGRYFGISMGLNDSRTYVIKGLFYNYGLVKSLGLSKTPAELFNEGNWTYSGFLEYCKQAQAILPENKYVMSGGPALVWSGMVNAAGVKLADKTVMELNLTHKYSLDALSVLTEVVSSNAWAIDEIGYDQNCMPFQRGDAIFQPGEYWFVRSENRFPSNLWGEGSTEYGYVPFPYPDTVKKEDTKVNFVGESIMMMVAGRNYGAGVTSEGVFRAVQDMYLRTVDAFRKSPNYNPEQVKYDSLTKKVDDVASIEATLFYTASRTMFDPLFDESFQYDYSGSLVTALINIVKGGDAAQALAQVESEVRTAFIRVHGS